MSNDEDEIPDDFFNDIADDTPDEKPIIENDPVVDDEQMKRCLEEIDRLQRNIERRKKKIETGESGLGTSSESKSRKSRQSRSRSKSRPRSRNDRSPRERSGRDRGRHRNERKRSRSRHRQRSRRSTSGSPRAKRSTSTHKNLSFLEELAQTFAARGQDFPEKDLLMQQNAAAAVAGTSSSSVMHGLGPNPAHFVHSMGGGANGGPFIPQPTGFGGHPSSYYGVNPTHALGGPSVLNQVSVACHF